MAKEFKGVINLDARDSVPDWEPYVQPVAPEGAPNVLMIIWDDVGFGAMDLYGGPIETPNMKRIADMGIRYSNFHTTALCSPTRSSLLTGRNATSNGLAGNHGNGRWFSRVLGAAFPLRMVLFPRCWAR